MGSRLHWSEAELHAMPVPRLLRHFKTLTDWNTAE